MCLDVLESHRFQLYDMVELRNIFVALDDFPIILVRC